MTSQRGGPTLGDYWRQRVEAGWACDWCGAQHHGHEPASVQLNFVQRSEVRYRTGDYLDLMAAVCRACLAPHLIDWPLREETP